MRVLHAAVECVPFATTGGLGDVLGALPGAQCRYGADARIVLPRYGFLDAALVEGPLVAELRVERYRARFHQSAHTANGARVYFCDVAGLFDRSGDPYRDAHGREFSDLALRFRVFSEAVARFARHLQTHPQLGFAPQIVHLHDWHTALTPLWMQGDPQSAKTVLSIHNLAFQGRVSATAFEMLGLEPAFWQAAADDDGRTASLMRAGIDYADAITTVSPGYAREIQTAAFGCGLQDNLRRRAAADALHGIVNGIDDHRWNPRTDPALAHPYGLTDVAAGKRANRQALDAELELPEGTRPLAVYVGRLTEQKGADLIAAAGAQLLGLDLQYVVLGVGDAPIAAALRQLAETSPRFVFRDAFDTALARRLIAAADLLIMPSRFEPCGMTQLYAQRYGTIPLVRRTGGLEDTVVDATDEAVARGHGTGFVFDNATAPALVDALRRALRCIGDPVLRASVQAAGMSRDLSWHAAAARYQEIYHALLSPSAIARQHARQAADAMHPAAWRHSSRPVAALTGA